MLPTRKEGRPGWMRLAGIGVELLAAILGFAVIGYWLGGYLGSARGGLVIGAVLGVVGGLYNAIRASLAITKETYREPPADKPR